MSEIPRSPTAAEREEPSIPPALTADEWRDREIASHYGVSTTMIHVDHRGRLFVHSSTGGAQGDVIVFNESGDVASLHRIAALCLHGQSFGFTQTDVDDLRFHASVVCKATGWTDHWADRLADRIAALLPPIPGARGDGEA